MSTITAILKPDVDGTVRLPLPAELRNSSVRIVATVEAVGSPARPRFGLLAGKIALSPDFDEPLEDCNDYMK